MICKLKKIVFFGAYLTAFTAAYAGDNTQTVSMQKTTHSQTARQEIPKHPKKGWKISAKDYAELVDDCGDSSDSGREGQSRSRDGTNRR